MLLDMDKYLDMFMEESKEHLQSLNECLLKIEKDNSNISILNEIFRNAHTIKGMSATMGFTVIADLTHEMENILDLLRKEELKCTPDIMDLLFRCVDTLDFLIENAGTNGDEIDISNLLQLLKNTISSSVKKSQESIIEISDNDIKIDSLTKEQEDKIRKAKKENIDIFEINVTLEDNSLLKAVRVFMVLEALKKIGQVVAVTPSKEETEKEIFNGRFSLLLSTKEKKDYIKNILLKIMEVKNVSINEFNLLDEESNNEQEANCSESENNTDKTYNNAKPKSAQKVRVSSDKLDVLLNIVGEIVINKTRLAQIAAIHKLRDLTETIEQMELITDELQSIVMDIRMVPVGTVFNRFPRMIRDLSRELGKKIELVIEGEDTELDRIIVDEIGQPLVHLLRNCVDHGIECIEKRQEIGKDPIGKIQLTAFHEASNIVIEIADDGQGIDLEIVKKKALEKGLINSKELSAMNPNEILRLIFLNGFSTATEVSDISGRGVGMDVVKNTIEALGGVVDVESKLGAGSKFKIKLPFTIEIVQALLVKVVNELYAIPLSFIDNTVNITSDEIFTVQNKEVFFFRKQIVPLLRLEKVLDVVNKDESTSNDENKELYVIVVQFGEQKAGLLVDSLIAQSDIVIKPLGKLLSNIAIISGATILGDGSVVLILDIGALIQHEHE